MTDQKKRQCSARIYSDGWGGRSCHMPAKTKRDKKWYCIIHDPEYVKAKRERQQLEYESRSVADKAKWDWNEARDKAVAGLTLGELQQLTPDLIRQVILAKTLGGET